MEPEDDCLLRPGRLLPAPGLASAPLTDEEMDALRRRVRFVWTSATLVGVVGRALRAAAAAAALSEGVDDLRRVSVKAERAADAAEGFAVEALSGCCFARGG